jgi:cell division protein FtsB
LAGLALGLLLLLQYPLWLGEGGWLKVREGSKEIAAHTAHNQTLHARNDALLADVADLKQGRDALEERARNELGMVAPDEWFVRVIGNAQPEETKE